MLMSERVGERVRAGNGEWDEMGIRSCDNFHLHIFGFVNEKGYIQFPVQFST